jgi:hypothetical protein
MRSLGQQTVKGWVGFSWYYIAVERIQRIRELTNTARLAGSIGCGYDPTGLLTVRIRNV